MRTRSTTLFAACVGGLLCAASGTTPAQAQAPPELHANARRAAGQRQLRVRIDSPEQLERVRALGGSELSCSGARFGALDVAVTAEGEAALAAAGIRFEVVRADLGRALDRLMSDNERLRARADVSWFEAYRTLDEIDARLAELAARYPDLARLESLGSSLEGRPIRVLRLSGPGVAEARPAFVVNAAQHAREWVTPMTVMYVAERLLEEYGSDARATAMLDKLELFLAPVMNPDGYVYSHGSNALWRKNRRRNGGRCDGIDLNRNWSYGYGGEGSSDDPCNEAYRGRLPFSEPEILGLKGLLDALGAQRRLMVHWDVHANARSILSPWGYTRAPPRELLPMNQLGAVIQAAMASVRGTSYAVGPISTQLYLASGVATDYVHGEWGAMAWGLELSGETFIPPQTEILPIAQEGYAGLLALSETVPARQ